MKQTLGVILMLLLPDTLYSHDEVSKASEEYRQLYQYENQKNQKVVLLAREDGHLIGQPFQIELRVLCKTESAKEPNTWLIRDSFSVCDMDPQSIRMNKQQTAFAMKVKEVDLEDYNRQLEAGENHPEPRCHIKTQIKKFSLKNLCP